MRVLLVGLGVDEMVGLIEMVAVGDLETDADCRAAVHAALGMLSRVGHSIEPAYPKALDEHENVAQHPHGVRHAVPESGLEPDRDRAGGGRISGLLQLPRVRLRLLR